MWLYCYDYNKRKLTESAVWPSGPRSAGCGALLDLETNSVILSCGELVYRCCNPAFQNRCLSGSDTIEWGKTEPGWPHADLSRAQAAHRCGMWTGLALFIDSPRVLSQEEWSVGAECHWCVLTVLLNHYRRWPEVTPWSHTLWLPTWQKTSIPSTSNKPTMQSSSVKYSKGCLMSMKHSLCLVSFTRYFWLNVGVSGNYLITPSLHSSCHQLCPSNTGTLVYMYIKLDIFFWVLDFYFCWWVYFNKTNVCNSTEICTLNNKRAIC